MRKLAKLITGGKTDFTLIIFVTMLSIFGVVMIFSASYYSSINESGTPYAFLMKQAFFVLSGFVLMFVSSKIDYHVYRHVAYPILIIEFILLVLVLTPFGTTIYGAARWIRIWKFTIMPGELAKPAIILGCAVYFSDKVKRARSLKGIAPVVLYTLAVCALILKQPNLSTGITVFLIAVGIAFCAGMQWRYMWLLGGVLLAGSYYIRFIDKSYWHDRFTTFLDPFADSSGDGFQVVQSLLALGTGGLFGLGLGKSVQKNLYLPFPHNDFILAIIGEELGFVGIAALLLIFSVTVWKIFKIGLRSRDQLGILLCSGIAMMIGLQVLLNVAVVTSSMPATGIALPFISYGGNSLWILMYLIGIVLNVARQGKEEE